MTLSINNPTIISQSSSTRPAKAYRSAVFVHWMSEFVVLRVLAEEEASLAHVEVEALQTSVPEAYDWIFLADVALRLMFG